MKTSARFLAMLLAVVMIASAALSVSAFDDVAGNKHANAINVLTQLKVIGGYEDGTFKPDQNVTRAEMAKLVYVLYTTFKDAGTNATAFKDVAADHWARGYIHWCSQQDIIGGYEDGTFRPENNVTYDEALKMVCAMLGYKDFQSNLWPTDVRMKALRTLDLGEELDDVKGGDQLTRAQVAQILYNALDEAMNEKKIVNREFEDAKGNIFYIPTEEAKQLAVDIWKFDEVTYTVAGTENFGSTVKEDKLYVYKMVNKKPVYDTWTLADYNLEKYEGNTDALYGLEIIAIENDEEEILSATVAGTVHDGVTVKYNAKAKTVLVVDGVEYTYSEKAPLYLWNLDSDTIANAFKADKDAKGKDIWVVNDDIVKALEDAYMARAIDVDGDGDIDRIVLADVDFYKVNNVKKDTKKTVVLYTLANAPAMSIPSADLTVAVEKDDIIAIADLGGINYTTIIEGVETYATKLAAADNKITLADVGVVEYADGKIEEVASKVLGEDNMATYYIYNGEIVTVTGIASTSEYKIAVLKDIIKKDDGTLNPSTMKYEAAYEAVLVIDGDEVTVPLSSDVEDTVLTIGAKKYTAEDAAKAFASVYGDTKKTETDGSPKYAYIVLSSYTEDEDGNYELKANVAMDSDDLVITAGSIAYDADKGVYTVIDTNNSKTYSRVVFDDNSVIFYTYKDEKTGDFKHLAAYDSESITEKSFAAKALTGTAYLVYNETNKTYTLAAAMVNDEIKGYLDSVTDYTNDGSLILYAPAGSAEVSKDGKLYYEYTFKEGFENVVVEGDKQTKDSTATTAGKFYGWNEKDEKYVEVTGVGSLVKATLDEIFYTKTSVLQYNTSETAALTDDVVIWGLDADEDGKTKDVYGEYKELSIADLSSMLDDAKANGVTIDAYLVRTLNKDKSTDSKLVWDVVEVIVNIYEINEETEKFEPINANLFAK